MQDIFLFIFIPFYVLFIFIFSYFFSKKIGYKNSFWFLFIFNLLMNIFGIVFTILFYIFFRKKGFKKEPPPILNLDLDRLIYSSYPIVKLSYRVGVGDFFDNERIGEDRKVKLLSFVRENISKEGMDLFFKSLSSKGDESRLFSFSSLNSMEEDLNRKIKEAKNRKDFKNLAILYFDFVYFKLATGDLKDFYLKKSLNAAKKALSKRYDDFEIYILIGKIYLYQNNLKEAKEYFNKAIFLNSSKRASIPYLLEIFYKTKDFNNFKYLLKDSYNISNPKVVSMLSFWKDR